MQLQPGTLLHGASYDYRIDSTLGQGSFGITYKATVALKGALGAINTNAAVAVKEFFMRDINSRSGSTVVSTASSTLYGHYRHDFQREAHNLSRLASEHIVKVLETFEANNTVYFTMELLDGGSLDSYIRQRGRLSEREALDGIVQVAEAVECMHRAQMLHLDIKPMNVMRRADGTLVLIDFGLSKQFTPDGQPETSTSIGGGTFGYAPLEQASYKKQDGFMPTLDIYALGATLYKMLTGTVPPDASSVFNDGFPYGALLQVGVSEAVADFVERAMEPMRRKRQQTVSAFIAEARALLPAAATAVKTTVTASASASGGDANASDGTVLGDIRPGRAATTPSFRSQSNLVDNEGTPRQVEMVSSKPTIGVFWRSEKPASFEVHWASNVDEEEKKWIHRNRPWHRSTGRNIDEEEKKWIRRLLQSARRMTECGSDSVQYFDFSNAYGLDTDNAHAVYRFSQEFDEYNLRDLYFHKNGGPANPELGLNDIVWLTSYLERATGLPFRIVPPDFLHIDWSASAAYWEQLRVVGFDQRSGLTISTFGAKNRGHHDWARTDNGKPVKVKLVLAGNKPLFNSRGFCIRSTQPVRDEVQPLGFGFYCVRNGGKWEVVKPSAPFDSLLDRKFDRVSALGFHGVPAPGPGHFIFGITAKDGDTNFYFKFHDGHFGLVDMCTDAQKLEMAQLT